MSAGPLREKVTFQRQGVGAGDGRGNQRTVFEDIAGATDIVAQLTPMRSGEAATTRGVEGFRLYKVRIRYTTARASITGQDKMVDARNPARAFNVKAPAVNPDQKKKWLEILVETGGANG